MYGDRNLLPSAFTLIVSLHHNAVIDEKVSYPRILPTDAPADHTRSQARNTVVVVGIISFDGAGLTAQSPKHLTAQQIRSYAASTAQIPFAREQFPPTSIAINDLLGMPSRYEVCYETFAKAFLHQRYNR